MTATSDQLSISLGDAALGSTAPEVPAKDCEIEPVSKKAIAAAVAGNALEFYDFVIYAFFAVYIGRAFFPLGSEFASLLASVATFGVGFFTRPLGGVIIGAFADRAGRKPAMILTVALITVSTIGMAITPAYATIGVAAPIIIVLCRLLQGLALGGEVGPASALLVETAPAGKRGLYSSWQIASQGLAVTTGGAVGVIVAAGLEPEQLQAWGWRIPFLVSLALIPIAAYIRRALPETLGESSGKSGSEVIGTVVRDHQRTILLGILVVMCTAVSTQVGNYMTTYAIHTLKLPAPVAQSATVLGGAMTFLFALAAGALSDRIGRRRMMILPRIALAIVIVPLFYWLDSAASTGTLMAVTAFITMLTAASAAPSLTAIPEMLPLRFRASGTSIIYAVGVTLFGGTTPFIVIWLTETSGPVAPAYYVVVTSIVSIVAMWLMPETRDVDVAQ